MNGTKKTSLICALKERKQVQQKQKLKLPTVSIVINKSKKKNFLFSHQTLIKSTIYLQYK